MARVGLAPGAALLDLSLWRPGQLRLAIEYLVWWTFGLIVTAIGGLMIVGHILGGGVGDSPWAILRVGLVTTLVGAMLGIGSSIAAGSATITGWALTSLIIVLSPWGRSDDAFIVVLAGTIGPAIANAVRYERRAGVVRRILTLVLAPLLATVLWVSGLFLTCVATTVLGAAIMGTISFSLAEGLGYLSVGFGLTFGSIVGPNSERMLMSG